MLMTREPLLVAWRVGLVESPQCERGCSVREMIRRDRHASPCQVSPTTEPLVRILLAIDAHSVFNELTPGFVRRKRTFDRARDMSRLRRAKRWADVTLIRPFQRVTLALWRVGDRSFRDRPRVSSSSTTGSHDSARPQASRSRPDNLRGGHARTHDDGADRPHRCQSGRCLALVDRWTQ